VDKKGTGLWMKAFSRPLTFTEIDLNNISPVSDEEARKRVHATQTKAMERERKARQEWEVEQARPKL